MQPRIEAGGERDAIMALVVLLILLAVLALLSGCSTRPVAVQHTPPLVTPCLSSPTAHVPDEPARPKVLTDRYVVDLLAWSNQLLGVITADRIAWRGERRCIRGLAEQKQIR